MPSPSSQSFRLLSLLALTIFATNAEAQTSPPTATEQQTIQKCLDATTKTNNKIAAPIEKLALARSSTSQIKALTSDLSSNAAQTLTAFADTLRELADANKEGVCLLGNGKPVLRFPTRPRS